MIVGVIAVMLLFCTAIVNCLHYCKKCVVQMHLVMWKKHQFNYEYQQHWYILLFPDLSLFAHVCVIISLLVYSIVLIDNIIKLYAIMSHCWKYLYL